MPLLGEVELENLPLKREALRHIGLPVEIKAGFIGKIRLQVPVRQIRTASWVIGMEQLYLVAGPINMDEVKNLVLRFITNYYYILTHMHIYIFFIHVNRHYTDNILHIQLT